MASVRFRGCCRQVQAEVVSNSRAKIHQTRQKPLSQASPAVLPQPHWSFIARSFCHTAAGLYNRMRFESDGRRDMTRHTACRGVSTRQYGLGSRSWRGCSWCSVGHARTQSLSVFVHIRVAMFVCARQKYQNSQTQFSSLPTQCHKFKLKDVIFLVCMVRSHPHIAGSLFQKKLKAEV